MMITYNSWLLNYTLNTDGTVSNGTVIDKNGKYYNYNLEFSSEQEAKEYLKKLVDSKIFRG